MIYQSAKGLKIMAMTKEDKRRLNKPGIALVERIVSEGWTRNDIADYLGISYQATQNWFGGLSVMKKEYFDKLQVLVVKADRGTLEKTRSAKKGHDPIVSVHSKSNPGRFLEQIGQRDIKKMIRGIGLEKAWSLLGLENEAELVSLMALDNPFRQWHWDVILHASESRQDTKEQVAVAVAKTGTEVPLNGVQEAAEQQEVESETTEVMIYTARGNMDAAEKDEIIKQIMEKLPRLDGRMLTVLLSQVDLLEDVALVTQVSADIQALSQKLNNLNTR